MSQTQEEETSVGGASDTEGPRSHLAPTPLVPDPHDPEDMLGAVLGLPQQLATAWERFGRAGPEIPGPKPRAVVLAGMGGSAIAGDLVAGLLADRLCVPLVVARDYDLPGWVGPKTLVVVASFSGDTDEALATFTVAGVRGARRVAITSGGRLAELATAAGLPVLRLRPGGQPRAGLGQALAALLVVLHAGQVLPDLSADVAAAVDLMAQGRDQDGAAGPAAALAGELTDRLALVWAPEAMAGVARRWKTQLNENAKVMAAWDTLPEMHHNSLVGLRDLAGLGRRLYGIVLTATGLPGPVARRIDLTTELLTERGLPHTLVSAPPGPALAQGLWLVLAGDLVSVRLARHLGVDPTPVPELTGLKARLAAGMGRLDSPDAQV